MALAFVWWKRYRYQRTETAEENLVSLISLLLDVFEYRDKKTAKTSEFVSVERVGGWEGNKGVGVKYIVCKTTTN